MNSLQISKSKIIIVILTLLLMLSAILNNFIISFVLMIGLLFYITKIEVLIPFYLVSSLSSTFFIALPGLGLSRFLAMILILSFLIYMAKRNVELRLNNLVILMLVILVIGYSTFGQAAYDKSEFYIFIFNILTLIIISSFTLTKRLLGKLLENLALIFTVTSFIIFTIMIINSSGVNLSENRGTISSLLNPNRLAMICAQTGTYLIAYALVAKGTKLSKRLYMFFGLINIPIIILTGSRSALIGIIIGLVIITLIYMFITGIKLKKVIKVLLALLSAVTVLLLLINYNPTIRERFDLGEVIDTGGTGRFVMIETLFKYILPENIWFGVGYGTVNESMALAMYLPNSFSAHNYIVSMLAQIGILGFIILNGFFIKQIINALKKIRSYNILLVPIGMITTALFNGIGEVVFVERWYWNNYILLLLILYFYSSNSKREERYLKSKY